MKATTKNLLNKNNEEHCSREKWSYRIKISDYFFCKRVDEAVVEKGKGF